MTNDDSTSSNQDPMQSSAAVQSVEDHDLAESGVAKTPSGSSPLRRSASRAIVVQLRKSGRIQQVREVLRPRGLSWLWRSRAPLWLQLIIADRDGRLLRDGDAVALREHALESERLIGPTLLHGLDRLWDLVCFLVPPSALLMLAAVLAVVVDRGSAGATVGLLLVLSALGWVALILILGVVRLSFLLLWRRPVDLAVGQLRTLNPTVTLLHADSPRVATALLERAFLTAGPLLVLTNGITAARPESGERSGLRVELLSNDHPVLVARRAYDPPPRTPSAPGRFRSGDAAVILGGTALALAFVAEPVASAERATCGTDCDDVPSTYGDALYWIVNRLFGGDPEGLGVGSVFGRLVGVLVTVYGLYVLVALVGAIVRQRMSDDIRSAADVVNAYEAVRELPHDYPPPDG